MVHISHMEDAQIKKGMEAIMETQAYAIALNTQLAEVVTVILRAISH